MEPSRPVLLYLTPAQAAALECLPELVEYVRKLVPGGESPVSAQTAARLARRRTATVIQALRDGAIPGRFIAGTHGGRGHWETMPSDVVAWARRSNG
jgi:hypothetical protein